ncbi:MAG: hypothetical protein ACFCU3_05295 [Verrucomicrobiales bacterium]
MNGLRKMCSAPSKKNSLLRFRLTGVQVLFGLLFVLVALNSGVARDIPPPFDLSWGVRSSSVERMLSEMEGLSLTQKSSSRRGEAWTVMGFPQEHLARAILHFDGRGLLYEVELQYEIPELNPERFKDYANTLRSTLESRYGSGRLFDREESRQGGATVIFEGYEWTGTSTVLRMIHFSATRRNDFYNVASLHYRRRS